MKIKSNIFKTVTVLLLLFLFSAGCKKKELQNGEMTVRMTDAPASFMKVNVEITGFEVNHDSKGWISLPVQPGIYNLLDLQNNVSVVLADHADIPIGKINQLRLILGSH